MEQTAPPLSVAAARALAPPHGDSAVEALRDADLWVVDPFYASRIVDPSHISYRSGLNCAFSPILRVILGSSQNP
jgi:hypothetical protein